MPSTPQFLINSESRTFIREYSESCGKYSFYTCTVFDPINQEHGEVASDYYPSNKYHGQYVESATIVSPKNRALVSITGRIPKQFNSQIYKLSEKRIAANIQLHFGKCTNPTIFNDFEEAIILENVRAVSYSTDRLGSLSRDENAIINETASLSVGRWYTIHKLYYSNIGARIISDGFVPLSMDVLDCDDCSSYGEDYCTIFVLAYDEFNPLALPYRVYISENHGRSWRYVELPIEIYDPTLIHAQFTTINVFNDYTYLHIRTDVGVTSESRIFSIPTDDLLRDMGIWSIIAVNGTNDNLPSSDRIVKFKHNYYAPYMENFDHFDSVYSRIIKFGTTIGSSFTPVYVPITNSDADGLYSDTPLYLYNYKDQILFSGIHIAVQDGDGTPKQLYITYTTNGNTWIEVPIIVDGVQITGTGSQYIHVMPINEKHWLVTVQDSTSTNKSFCTLNGGASWKSIPSAFKGDGLLATYIPTESVLFSATQRSYDSGVTAVNLPDNDSDIEYNTIIQSFPSLHGEAHARAFGCRNNPNLMLTYGEEGVYLFV